MQYEKILELNDTTLEQCLSLYKKGLIIVINDGYILNFEKED